MTIHIHNFTIWANICERERLFSYGNFERNIKNTFYVVIWYNTAILWGEPHTKVIIFNCFSLKIAIKIVKKNCSDLRRPSVRAVLMNKTYWSARSNQCYSLHLWIWAHEELHLLNHVFLLLAWFQQKWNFILRQNNKYCIQYLLHNFLIAWIKDVYHIWLGGYSIHSNTHPGDTGAL